MTIYTDSGAGRGNRTKLFRDCANGRGVEWIYAVDHAGGCNRWFGFGMAPDNSIAKLIAGGMDLEPQRNFPTELTPEGEQHVIPGCERNASPKAKQLDLFG